MKKILIVLFLLIGVGSVTCQKDLNEQEPEDITIKQQEYKNFCDCADKAENKFLKAFKDAGTDKVKQAKALADLKTDLAKCDSDFIPQRKKSCKDKAARILQNNRKICEIEFHGNAQKIKDCKEGALTIYNERIKACDEIIENQ